MHEVTAVLPQRESSDVMPFCVKQVFQQLADCVGRDGVVVDPIESLACSDMSA